MSVSKIPVPDYSLTEAAFILGMEKSTLIRLAESGGIQLCFIFRVAPGSGGVSWIQYDPDMTRVIGDGTMYGNSFLIFLDPSNLPQLIAGDRLHFGGGILYPSDDDEKNVSLSWGTGKCYVALDDIRVPAYEVDALKKAGEFYKLVDGLNRTETGDKPAATLEPQEPHRFDYQRAKDAWTDAMKDLSIILHRELGCNANSTQAWTRMITDPPHGYSIEKKGRQITMPGEKPMDRPEFKRRWKNFTGKD